MRKTSFRIGKMDCPSEEQLIRMKLADVKSIQSLDFDIPKRILTVFHTGDYEQIMQRLDGLNNDKSIIISKIPFYPVPLTFDGFKRADVLLLSAIMSMGTSFVP
jgi:hypothetical protein